MLIEFELKYECDWLDKFENSQFDFNKKLIRFKKF